MSHRPTRRLVRAAAGATAGVVLGATALVAATPAAAAGSGSPILYRATTGTGVVQLVLTLPAGAAALPIPRPAVLTLIGTDGQGLHSAGTPDLARTDSFLAGGSLITGTQASAALRQLGRVLTADLAHPHPAAPPALTVPSTSNPLGLALGVGTQTANVQPTTSSAATSTLAKASLGSLDSLGLAPVLDPLATQLNAAVTALTNGIAPVTDALKMIPTVPSMTVPNPLPIRGGPATIRTPALGGPTVAATVTELPAQVQALLAKLLKGDVIQLNGLDTSQGIAPNLSSVTGTGRSKLADIQLFGGLVAVTGSAAVATATAGLTKSAATSGASATLLSVKVSDSFGTLLSLLATDKGITAALLDGTLGTLDSTVKPTVAAADAALNTLLKQLTDVLAMLNSGAKLLRQGTATHTVSPDGRTAEAHAVPAQVTLGLPGATNLLQLSIGRADAVVAVATPVAPAAPVAAGAVLPRTGLEQGGTVAAALLLVSGLGLVAVRRRRLSA